MTATTRKYNPGFLTDEELIAGFCARTSEYESIVETLRECTTPSNQHLLVIGPRGSGKTTLLLRVAAKLRRDTDISSRLLPVVFAEESYHVSTCGEFWLECLSRLAEQVCHQHEIDLERSWNDLRKTTDDDTLALRCLGAVLDLADLENKRLVLIVENLNMMFADMMDPNAGWRLRKTLQTEPRIVFLGSATSRFDEIDHRDKALYDLFHVHFLQPLTTQECAVLWGNVSGKEPEQDKIRPLQILTGGSPRLLAIIAQFGAAMSFHELMSDLLALVDEHTEYFKSHLESLPAQERRVYLALAEAWEPATTREVADRARIGTNKCSAWLKRLVDRGSVLATGGTARRKLYYLTERMYNIYYLLRRKGGTSGLVEALVQFMASFYSQTELRNIRDRIAHESVTPASESYPYLQDALETLTNRLEQTDNEPVESPGTHDRTLSLPDAGEPMPRETAAMTRFNRAVALGKLGRKEEELSAYNDVVDRFGEDSSPSVLEVVVRSLVNNGIVLGQMGRSEEELEAYDEVVNRFDDGHSPVSSEGIAKAMCLKGGVLENLEREDEALATYEEVVNRFGKEESPALVQISADALLGKAEIELTRDCFDAAIATAAQALDLCGPDVPHVVILGHGVRAVATLKIGDEVAAERDVVAMLAALPEIAWLPKICLEALMRLHLRIGPERTLPLIQSPTLTNLLYPLAVVVMREVGLEPRVAPEVEEVADDIRLRLDQMRHG